MLGYISSNKWLEVGYGEPFQEFLLRNVKILYVIEFDRAVFPDAEVDTAVVVLQKESDPEKRRSNIVKFVRVKRPVSQAELLKLLELEEDFEDERIRVTSVRQGKLKPGKWNIYLRAPPVFKKLLNHPKMKPLGEVAEVLFGLKTGYNEFFILSKDRAKEWGIEPEFLVPCVSSPKKIKGLVIRPEDVDEYFFMCDKPKEELKGTRALEYIEYGETMEIEVIRGSRRERRKLPELETVKGRRLWYALPKLPTPSILFPRMMRERIQIFLNQAKAQGVHVFSYVIIENAKAMSAFLLSSLAKAILELTGRQYTGMLDIETGDLCKLMVLDPLFFLNYGKKLEDQFLNLSNAVDARVKAEEYLESIKSTKKGQPGILELEARKKLKEAIEAEKRAQKELDEAVYDILGLTEEERRQVEEGLKELQELRRARTKV